MRKQNAYLCIFKNFIFMTAIKYVLHEKVYVCIRGEYVSKIRLSLFPYVVPWTEAVKAEKRHFD